MDRIVDHVLAFEGEGYVKDFSGNFSEYRLWKKANSVETSSGNTITADVQSAKIVKETNKKKLSYKEQRELETIEKEMPVLEKERNMLLEALNKETEYQKIAELSAKLKQLSEKLELYELRWLELQEAIS
jgi:ATP-binding cassette subfamily F protein uup